MKQQLRWLFIILILLSFLLLRIFFKSEFKNKFLFNKKEIVEISFKDTLQQDISIKKQNNSWILTKNVNNEEKSFPANKQEITDIIENIKNFQIIESISKSSSSFSKYELEDTTAKQINVSFVTTKNKIKTESILLGKSGGFSWEETYARLKGNNITYLTKGLNKYDFDKPFYQYCDKTVIKVDKEKINFIQLNYQNKLTQLKKELINNTTIWVNVKTKEEYDYLKISDYLEIFKEFTADGILEEVELKNPVLEITFGIFGQKEDIKITFYELTPNTYLPSIKVYPVKIQNLSETSSVDFIAKDTTIFFINDSRFDSFKNLPSK